MHSLQNKFYMIFDEFNFTRGYFPHTAVNKAITYKEIITPFLLDILQETIHNYERSYLFKMDYIYALYLLSKFREQKTFPLIIKLLQLPEEILDLLLEDCVTQDLSTFIVSTYNGNLPTLKTLIQNTNGNLWAKDAILRSLVGLVATNQLRREDVLDYFRTLFHQPSLMNTEFFAAFLIEKVCDLWPKELYNEVMQAFDTYDIDPLFIDEDYVESTLKLSKEDCLKQYVYDYKYHLPIDDVYEAMSWMCIFSDSLIKPYKVGRNELCPCESNKKYKKCCLINTL